MASEVLVKEKRTKPCSNCKRAKVKCKYTDDLPCERCLKTGLAASCQFVLRLPSIKYVQDPLGPTRHEIGHHNAPQIYEPTVSRMQFDPLAPMLRISPHTEPPPVVQYGSPAVSRTVPVSPSGNDANPDREWKLQIESRIDSFDSKLSDLVDILRSNQQALLVQLQRQLGCDPISTYQPEQQGDFSPQHGQKRPISANDESSGIKRHHTTHCHIDIVTREEAQVLIEYFDAHISPQLFGFDIRSMDFESIYSSCPILMCAICAIACIHHPELADKGPLLRKELKRLCGAVIFESKPRSQGEAFSTIIALILCSFWWSDNQTLTGIALQLAKEFGFNSPNTHDKRHLKLWYLLYILDGQQSLTYNRQRLVDCDDTSISQCRHLLPGASPKAIENDSDADNKTKHQPPDHPRSHSLCDMRLVSQVEYNLALSEAFRGNAWELLVPSSFGIPSRSNLELDKWMVSWTVLLATGNHGAVWSSKSTLIYYNFAKIHLNSHAMRQLKATPASTDTQCLPKWKEPTAEEAAKSPLKDHSSTDANSSEDSSDDEDDFITNTDLAANDDPEICSSIAVSAARTVLNLVVNDNDILQNLRYVPVHIHLMLYYAALLLVNGHGSSVASTESVHDTHDRIQSSIQDLRLVKTLQARIDANFPIDTSFGKQLVHSLDELVLENMAETSQAIALLPKSAELVSLRRALGSVTCPDHDATGNGNDRPQKEKLYAWPGSDHGHP